MYSIPGGGRGGIKIDEKERKLSTNKLKKIALAGGKKGNQIFWEEY